jgi:hypothetical protein
MHAEAIYSALPRYAVLLAGLRGKLPAREHRRQSEQSKGKETGTPDPAE